MIADGLEANGYSPTYREIGDACGFVSTNAASDHLKLLERHQLVECPGGKCRAIVITRPGYEAIGRGKPEPVKPGKWPTLLVAKSGARFRKVWAGDMPGPTPCPQSRGGHPPSWWDSVGLGTVPDARIAEQHGVGHHHVYNERTARGIPPHRGGRWRDPKLAGLLGEMPDAELARELGVSRQRVGQVRNGRGVSRFGTSPPAPAEGTRLEQQPCQPPVKGANVAPSADSSK